MYNSTMTTNAFILSWDCTGLEAAVPITQYEQLDHQNLLNVIAGKQEEKNPVGNILYRMKLRAQFNSQRFYEIYAIDCEEELTEDDWHSMFKSSPQSMAELIREKGIKIFCNRRSNQQVVIS